MSSHKDYPHIYNKKKYIGLQIQNVSRGDPDYLFTGGKGVEGCIKQLNNINAITGNIHIMCNYICRILGIKTTFYKDQPEDNGGENLLLQINKIDFSSLEAKLNSLERQIENLEQKLTKIEIILEIVKRIDEKV